MRTEGGISSSQGGGQGARQASSCAPTDVWRLRPPPVYTASPCLQQTVLSLISGSYYLTPLPCSCPPLPQVVQMVLSLISDSLDAWRTRQYDYYQRVMNGIL